MKPDGDYSLAENSLATAKKRKAAELDSMMDVLTGDAQRVAFPANVLETVRSDKGELTGFKFKLRNTFYCAQPISCISDIKISVDGTDFAPQQILLILRDQCIGARYAHTFHELWWGFGESLEVLINPSDPALRDALARTPVTLHIYLTLRTSFTYGLPGDRYRLHLTNTMEVR